MVTANKYKLAALSAAISGVLSAGALAQGTQLEEIVVTAQKRAQSINDIPMSISAISGDQMDEMGILDTTDLAANIPGLTYSPTAFGPPVYTLRGVGFNESSPQATSTVGVYVDQIAIPFPIMTTGAMIDVDRVEVLKGPQGTLYGRNSTGGAINYIAAKPTEEFEAGINASYGRYQTFSVDGYLSGALTDSIRSRLAVRSVQSNEGWQESITRGDELGEQDKLALRFTTDFDFNDKFSGSFSFSHATDKSDSLAPQLVQLTGGYSPLLGLAGFEDDGSGAVVTPDELVPGSDPTEADWTNGRTPSLDHETNSYRLHLQYDLTDRLTLTSLSGYSSFDDNGSEYERGSIAGANIGESAAIDPGWLKGKYRTLPDSDYMTTDYVYQDGDIDSFSQELRVTGTYDSVIWMAGLYYSDSDVSYLTQQDFGASSNTNFSTGLGFSGLDNDVDQDTTTKAAYLNADWFINEKLTLTTGIRYSEDEANYKGCTRAPSDNASNTWDALFQTSTESGDCLTIVSPVPPSGNPREAALAKKNLDEDSTSWRLAANYDLTDDTSIYASYSRGYKAGSFPSLAAVADEQLDPVVKEQLDAYEIGFKMSFADGSAQLNGAAFYYDYQDKQLLTKVLVPVFRQAFALGNVDESEVYGVELDLQWVPVDGLTLAAAASWLDTEITDGVGFNQKSQKLDLDGSDLPFTPELEAFVSAQYEWAVGSGMSAWVAVDASYTDDSNTDVEGKGGTTLPAELPAFGIEFPAGPYEYDDRYVIDSYTLVNARLGLEAGDGQWRGYLWGRNLTDEFYTSTTLQNNRSVARYPSIGRTYGVTLEYYWK
ncbi:MAG: TonB-dependent receptor [Halieaceae bacterium]